jgi:hypothetical protein
VFFWLAVAVPWPGLLWSVVAIAVLLGYHTPEPSGVLGVTIGGHTYVGHPPRLTLYERDPVSFVIVLIVLAVGLLVSTLEVVTRRVRRSRRTGTLSIVAGSCVILISLFGLLVGLAGGGVVGALLICTGLSGRRATAWNDPVGLVDAR